LSLSGCFQALTINPTRKSTSAIGSTSAVALALEESTEVLTFATFSFFSTVALLVSFSLISIFDDDFVLAAAQIYVSNISTHICNCYLRIKGEQEKNDQVNISFMNHASFCEILYRRKKTLIRST
jgi:hypothetical protein